jgi:signal peptidase
VSAVALPAPRARRGGALDRFLTVLLTLLLVLLALGLGLRAAGLTALVDYSDSMKPAIAAGDVVIDREFPASAIRTGQIVSIPDPGLDGRLITHRVVSAQTSGTQVVLVTRGDAATSGERWTLAADEPVKRMVMRVPAVGHVALWLGHPIVRTLVMLAAALGLVAWAAATLRGELSAARRRR